MRHLGAVLVGVGIVAFIFAITVPVPSSTGMFLSAGFTITVSGIAFIFFGTAIEELRATANALERIDSKLNYALQNQYQANNRLSSKQDYNQRKEQPKCQNTKNVKTGGISCKFK